MTEKLWGRAYPLLETEQMRVVKVEINPQWKCSTHTHEQQHNHFFVISGMLDVVVWPKSPDEKRHMLMPGQSLEVKAGIPHYFQSITNVTAIEVYRATEDGKCSADDIQRLEQGMYLGD